MLKYCVVFKIKQTPFNVTIFRAVIVCLWLHRQFRVDVVTVLVCCVRSAPGADRDEHVFKGFSKEEGPRP